MKDLPLCERCGKPVSPDDDVYNEVLLRHHGHKACAWLADQRCDRQMAAFREAEEFWAGKDRECPKCGTSFASCQDRGVCPTCQFIFWASNPELGDVRWWRTIE